MADFNRFQTAEQIINAAAVEVGLSAASNPYSSTDASFTQLRTLLGTVGLELTLSPWSRLLKEASISVNYGDSGEYDLPTDFDSMLSQTFWDRSATLEVEGPLNAQDWQYYKANTSAQAVLSFAFRVNQDKIRLLPTPPTTGSGLYTTLYYEYVSRGWVQDATSSTTYRDTVVNAADKIMYDPILVIKMLKLRFLEAKGFDTTAASSQFSTAWNSAMNKSEPGSVVSVVGRNSGFAYLDPDYVSNINQ